MSKFHHGNYGIGYQQARYSNDSKSKVPIPQSINFKTDAKLIIMPDLKDQIDYLHAMVGSKEWSGILFYKIINGSIDKPDELKIEAHYVMPLDIGSSVYTEYDPDGATLDAFDMFEGAEDMERGTIHTHHNMATFFSSTDTEDLLEKVADESHSYYLSLIVNVAELYSAKIAVLSEKSFTEYSVSIGDATHSVRIPTEDKKVLTYEISEFDLPEGKEMPKPFREQVQKIIDATKTPNVPGSYSNRTSSVKIGTESSWERANYAKEEEKTRIPGVSHKKSEDEEKEILNFNDVKDEMFAFADILTVGSEYGSINDVLECVTIEELIEVVYDSLKFYSTEETFPEIAVKYREQLRDHLFSRLIEDGNTLTTPLITTTVTEILKILDKVKLPKEALIFEFHGSLKAFLRGIKNDAYNELVTFRLHNSATVKN